MFSKKTVCFITGASRGLGEGIALNLGPKFPQGSAIVLLARCEDDLFRVKSRLEETAHHLTVIVHRFDQSTQDPQAFDAVFSQTLESVKAKVTDFQQALLVNNAGSIKPTVFIRNLPQVRQLTEYMSVNVSGVIALTSQFLKVFPSPGIDRVVINISSLAAVQPFSSWSLYSSGKAARDMFFKVLAEEEKDVRVLNYAPGPLKTDMMEFIITGSEDKGVCSWLAEGKEKDTLLTCAASVAKLHQILEKNSFESGVHFDYYDEI